MRLKKNRQLSVEIKSKMEVSTFVLDKKSSPKHLRKDEEYIDLYKKSVERGNKLKHSNILNVIKPLLELSNQLAFVTERVNGSLANSFGININCNHLFSELSQSSVTMPPMKSMFSKSKHKDKDKDSSNKDSNIGGYDPIGDSYSAAGGFDKDSKEVSFVCLFLSLFVCRKNMTSLDQYRVVGHWQILIIIKRKAVPIYSFHATIQLIY